MLDRSKASERFSKGPSPLTDLSQSWLWDSSRSGSVTALPGRVVLKKAKSSSVILEKGRLAGTASGGGVGGSASVRSLLGPSPSCHQEPGWRPGRGLTEGGLLGAKVPRRPRWGTRTARSFSILCRIAIVGGERRRRVTDTRTKTEGSELCSSATRPKFPHHSCKDTVTFHDAEDKAACAE